jgi:hypothetical protein
MPKTLTKYNDAQVFKLYEILRSGATFRQAAGLMGVCIDTLKAWRREYPIVQEAVRAGRAARALKEDGGVGRFMDYVYERLPGELQELWDKIQRWDAEENGVLKIEAALEEAGKYARQHLFIHSWVTSNFKLATALKLVNISRSTFKRWCEEDDQFCELLEEIQQYKKDFFEDALIGLVALGDSPATIFANKTINKDRGYGESKKQQVEVIGKVEHEHMMTVEDLDLPVEVQRAMLESLRERKALGMDEVVDGEIVEDKKT